MTSKGRIIFLNGVGSSGKSSIAKALQEILSTPHLHVQMDAFLDMLPEDLQNHPDGLWFDEGEQDGQPSVSVGTGQVGDRLLAGMRQAVVAMAEAGNNLILDEVLLGPEKTEYRRFLSPLETVWIGIHAPLDILEARERARGDRLLGLARWQFEKVHADMRYDLELDSSVHSPQECAVLIKRTFDL